MSAPEYTESETTHPTETVDADLAVDTTETQPEAAPEAARGARAETTRSPASRPS